MPYLTFHITLEEPAMFAALEGEPNSSVSYDFIPGSAIRGLFISAYMRANGAFDATDNKPQQLFFSDDILYLNAYPLIDGQRSLPVPMSWQDDKYPTPTTENKILDSVHQKPKQEDKQKDEKKITFEKAQRLKGFTVLDDTQAKIMTVERVINVHMARARKTSDEQQVFRYDAIAEGQTFVAVIMCDDEATANELKQLLNEQDYMTIGGVRNAGYGLVSLSKVEVHGGNYREAAGNIQDEITITLLSDVILRDKYGNYAATPRAFFDVLQTEYGIEIAETPAIVLTIDTTMVGGFNRKWGVPLPQTPALKRGSVLKVTLAKVDDAALTKLLQAGVGERRNEGFGRVALNWQQQPELQRTMCQDETTSKPHEELVGVSKTMWERLEYILNRQQEEQKIIERIYEMDNLRIMGDISITQITNLRSKIADILRQQVKPQKESEEKEREEQRKKLIIADFKKHLRDIEFKAAGKALRNARIAGKSMNKWLTDQVDEKPDHPEMQLRLIDAVLERSQKEKSAQAKRKAQTNG
jgi:CRISPR-associated protein Csx10